uniref:Ubiquitin-like domain-containing protein n=1 Tax=Trypanosoma congolense (strain IL3000) TaxID=1068625 RepID=G0UVL2_TRYCI|nr:conserved hypothetical protein [Trypanosoma congolense IL3000]
MNPPREATANGELTEICVNVVHATKKFDIVLPAATSRVGDLKEKLAQSTGVPIERQRLLFDTRVATQYRGRAPDTMKIIDMLASRSSRAVTAGNKASSSTRSLLEKGADGNPTGGGSLRAVAAPTSAPPQSSVLKLPVMLLGTAASAPHVDEEMTAQMHRLTSIMVEHENKWFRCTYGKGYARQRAFVCRTCLESGAASATHAICCACAEVCHKDHNIEEWGVRYFMRCDCCTPACWQNVSGGTNEQSGNETGGDCRCSVSEASNNSKCSGDEAEKVDQCVDKGAQWVTKAEDLQHLRRCCFIMDSDTGKPPASREAIPLNSRNRYPRSSSTWCFCRCTDDHPADGTDEAEGFVCMLCTSCYWGTHITRLNTDIVHCLPCCGQVLEGDIVAFNCRTCASVICGPCRLRCHRDHDADETVEIYSHEEQTGEPVFKCGCGCSTKDGRADCGSSIDENSPQIPWNVAAQIMKIDSCVGFVCAHCMQEYPWLMNKDYRKCYGGRLPDAVPVDQHLPIVPCSFPPTEECPDGTFPFHGMLYPYDAFTEEMTCNCLPCRQAYDRFAPRTTVSALDFRAVELHNTCDNCGHDVQDEKVFICQTCELQSDTAYFACQQCNKLRIEAGLLGMNVTSNGISPSSDNVADTNASSVGEGEPWRWDHPPGHVFLEETSENLVSMCEVYLRACNDDPTEMTVLKDADHGGNLLQWLISQEFGGDAITYDPKDVAQHCQQQQRKKQQDKNGEATNSGRTAEGLHTSSTAVAGQKHPRTDSAKEG